MGLLEGKVVLVTGGARGQGRAHAVVSAREGADIVVLDTLTPASTVVYPTTMRADLDATVGAVEDQDRRALAIEADVRDEAALDRAVATALAEFGHIDVVIANAGIWSLSPSFWETTSDQWNDMIDINLSGVWKTVRAVAPHLVERQSGSVVVTCSVNGLEPAPGFAHYTAAKHGVVGLMKSMALDLAPHGVRCNAVNPGFVDTAMTNNPVAWDLFAGGSGGTPADFVRAGYSYGLLKDSVAVRPEAIAEAALFLNSPMAQNITGICLPIENGHLLVPGVNPAH